jgi:hypothetical protein
MPAPTHRWNIPNPRMHHLLPPKSNKTISGVLRLPKMVHSRLSTTAIGDQGVAIIRIRQARSNPMHPTLDINCA